MSVYKIRTISTVPVVARVMPGVRRRGVLMNDVVMLVIGDEVSAAVALVAVVRPYVVVSGLLILDDDVPEINVAEVVLADDFVVVVSGSVLLGVVVTFSAVVLFLSTVEVRVDGSTEVLSGVTDIVLDVAVEISVIDEMASVVFNSAKYNTINGVSSANIAR